jgi:hypothetical protein
MCCRPFFPHSCCLFLRRIFSRLCIFHERALCFSKLVPKLGFQNDEYITKNSNANLRNQNGDVETVERKSTQRARLARGVELCAMLGGGARGGKYTHGLQEGGGERSSGCTCKENVACFRACFGDWHSSLAPALAASALLFLVRRELGEVQPGWGFKIQVLTAATGKGPNSRQQWGHGSASQTRFRSSHGLALTTFAHLVNKRSWIWPFALFFPFNFKFLNYIYVGGGGGCASFFGQSAN